MLLVEMGRAENSERCRIARGLHDGAGQTISLARIKAGALKRDIPEWLSRQLEEIAALLEQADDQLRALTVQLCPPVLDQLGFDRAVEWMADHFQEQHGVACKVQATGSFATLSDTVRATLFDTLREVLRNIARHAGAKRVSIRLHQGEGAISLCVGDDGKGFDERSNTDAAEAGLGLFGIRERVEQIGGRFDLVSVPGRGTEVSVSVPLDPPAK
jgi:signal transduction histidine kinase